MLAGTGVATVQALMPGVCKRWLAGNIVLAMGLYSAVLVGFCLGGCFSLCLIVSLDHLPGVRAAGALAAFVQDTGFLITAAGPWLVGVLRESGGDFVDAWWHHRPVHVAARGALQSRRLCTQHGAAEDLKTDCVVPI